jgi:hypothetical protein
MKTEKLQDDNIDRGEIRTVFSRSHSDIAANGKKMCEKHVWKKLSDNEVYCVNCPTALIVNPDVIDDLVK